MPEARSFVDMMQQLRTATQAHAYSTSNVEVRIRHARAATDRGYASKGTTLAPWMGDSCIAGT